LNLNPLSGFDAIFIKSNGQKYGTVIYNAQFFC